MQMENDTFPEAVKRLADRVHITLPQPQYTQQAKEQELQRQRLLIYIKRQDVFFMKNCMSLLVNKQEHIYKNVK